MEPNQQKTYGKYTIAPTTHHTTTLLTIKNTVMRTTFQHNA